MDPYTTHGSFSWSELMTHDPAAALEFYRQLFGWQVETMNMADGPYHVVKVGDAAVGGVMQMPPPAAAGGMPPTWGVYVTVSDVDQSVAQAVQLGGKLIHGPMDVPTVGRLAVIADPQGAVVNIITYTPPAT